MTPKEFIPTERLTFSTIETNQRRLESLFLEKKYRAMIINLSNVQLCDSAGLAQLIEAKRLAIKHGVDIRIFGFTVAILKLATFYGMDQLLLDELIHAYDGDKPWTI